jgi:hypothetical protein
MLLACVLAAFALGPLILLLLVCADQRQIKFILEMIVNIK